MLGPICCWDWHQHQALFNGLCHGRATTEPWQINKSKKIILECDINYKGNNVELIPFETGKKICPGLPLAHRTTHLMVASLLHNFEWNLVDGLKPEDMNMEEQFGLTLKRVQSLQVQALSLV